MKVAIIHGDGYFPGDVRVDKEVKTLKGAGHEIYVICRLKEGQNEKDTALGATVVRCRQSGFMRRLNFEILHISDFKVYPFWKKKVSEFLARVNPDIIHIHELNLASVTIPIAKKKGIPVILDLHEYYPELAKTERFNPFYWFFNSPKKMERMQIRAMKNSDQVIVVSQEYADDLRDVYPEVDTDIRVVSNTVELSYADNLKSDDESLEQVLERPVINYAGILQRKRGIHTVIQALPEIRRACPDTVFEVIGKGRYEKKLVSLAKRLGLESSVLFTDWVDLAVLPEYIRKATFCVIPLIHKTKQTDLSSPNKAYEGMIMSKPLLVSDCKSMKNLIGEVSCGLVFKANDPHDLAEKAIELIKNPEMCREMGARGRKAVLDKYNWNIDEQELLDIYRLFETEKLVKNR